MPETPNWLNGCRQGGRHDDALGKCQHTEGIVERNRTGKATRDRNCTWSGGIEAAGLAIRYKLMQSGCIGEAKSARTAPTYRTQDCRA